jgi:hypothetical protein
MIIHERMRILLYTCSIFSNLVDKGRRWRKIPFLGDTHGNSGGNQPLHHYFGCRGEITMKAQLKRNYNFWFQKILININKCNSIIVDPSVRI